MMLTGYNMGYAKAQLLCGSNNVLKPGEPFLFCLSSFVSVCLIKGFFIFLFLLGVCYLFECRLL